MIANVYRLMQENMGSRQENMGSRQENMGLRPSHTILLIQPVSRADSRTWSDYETTAECLEAICKIFEEHLKKQNPNSTSITYDVHHLYDFIDRLADLACLVYDYEMKTYIPHNKDWIKEQIYVLLRQQASKK